MSHPTPEELENLRAELVEQVAGRKIIILGVGKELRGDDALGPVLARRLDDRVAATVLDVQDVPENYAVRTSDMGAEVALILDAAQMHLPTGSVRLLVAADLPPVPGGSHRPSLEMFAAFVRLDGEVETFVLGIQPDMSRVGMGDEMSDEVCSAMDAVERVMVEVLGPDAN